MNQATIHSNCFIGTSTLPAAEQGALSYAAKQPKAAESAIIAYRKAHSAGFSQQEYDHLLRRLKERER